MTTYTRPLGGGTPTTGQVVKAVHVNDPIDQIYDTILAGGITADQIAVGAVDTSDLATAAVTAAKMDGTLPDASAMATSTAPTTDKQLANKKYVDDQIVSAAPTAKAWCQFASDGTLQTGDHNVSTVTRTGLGSYTVAWTTDFANTLYAVFIQAHMASGNIRYAAPITLSTTGCTFEVFDGGNTLQDATCSVVAFGLQV